MGLDNVYTHFLLYFLQFSEGYAVGVFGAFSQCFLNQITLEDLIIAVLDLFQFPADHIGDFLLEFAIAFAFISGNDGID